MILPSQKYLFFNLFNFYLPSLAQNFRTFSGREIVQGSGQRWWSRKRHSQTQVPLRWCHWFGWSLPWEPSLTMAMSVSTEMGRCCSICLPQASVSFGTVAFHTGIHPHMGSPHSVTWVLAELICAYGHDFCTAGANQNVSPSTLPQGNSDHCTQLLCPWLLACASTGVQHHVFMTAASRHARRRNSRLSYESTPLFIYFLEVIYQGPVDLRKKEIPIT